MKNVINMFEKDSIEILTAESNHSFPLHSHECFCLGVVYQGQVKFHIEEQEKILTKGMFYIIPSNVGVIITPVERYGYTTICFKNEVKDYFMQYRYEQFFPEIEQGNQILKLCTDYINGISRQSFMESIVPLLRPFMLERNDVRKDDDDLVELGKEYIRQHIYERFNLDALSNHVHMSKYHYLRKFKQKTGVTPNQYYIQAKMFAAKQALKQNERETDLAASLNFSDQSYMCNVFKKQMGISMKEFKEHYFQL